MPTASMTFGYPCRAGVQKTTNAIERRQTRHLRRYTKRSSARPLLADTLGECVHSRSAAVLFCWRIKDEYARIAIVSAAHCRVSYVDKDGFEHAADVDAESLYEAVALAIAEFRNDELNTCEPALMTEFTIQVFRRPTEHKVRLKQVHDWAKHTVSEGPAGIVKRERVRKLLHSAH
jgi:hypothetical protein